MSKEDREGMIHIVFFLDSLNPAKRCVPDDIKDPDALIRDAKVRERILFHMKFATTTKKINNSYMNKL